MLNPSLENYAPSTSKIPKIILLNINRDGTMFSISHTPIDYGKEKEGKLLIYTDEMLWSYLIKGSFPTYKVPE